MERNVQQHHGCKDDEYGALPHIRRQVRAREHAPLKTKFKLFKKQTNMKFTQRRPSRKTTVLSLTSINCPNIWNTLRPQERTSQHGPLKPKQKTNMKFTYDDRISLTLIARTLWNTFGPQDRTCQHEPLEPNFKKKKKKEKRQKKT